MVMDQKPLGVQCIEKKPLHNIGINGTVGNLFYTDSKWFRMNQFFVKMIQEGER